MKIAVIGAGFTGSLLTHMLKDSGHQISVFEKSRGCGGRACSKTATWGQADIGATVIPAVSLAFQQFMHSQCELGLADNWPKNLYQYDHAQPAKGLQAVSSTKQYFVFKQKMNLACRHWLAAADLNLSQQVTELAYQPTLGWRLKIDQHWHTQRFDKVLLTAPWPQTQALIQQSHLPLELANLQQEWTSCWSVVLQAPQSLESKIDLLYLKQHEVQTLVRDSHKTERPKPMQEATEIWYAHLSNALSERLGRDGQNQAKHLATEALAKLFNLNKSNIKVLHTHYWRFARPQFAQQPLGMLTAHNNTFFAAGDWSYGASIESAFLAAQGLSQALINKHA